MLTINQLSLDINKQNLIKNFSLDLKNNENLYLLGENGSGKSTLLNELIFPHKKKTVFINNKDIKGVNDSEKNNFFSILLQQYNINTDIFVEEVLEFSEIKNTEIYDFFNLKKFISRKIKSLSGGEKQKLFIYSALTQKSELYLLDEPFNNLDFNSFIFLDKFFNNFKKSVIMTVHDLNHIRNINSKIGFISNNNIYFYNNLYEFIKSEQFRTTFKGIEFEKKNNHFYFIY